MRCDDSVAAGFHVHTRKWSGHSTLGTLTRRKVACDGTAFAGPGCPASRQRARRHALTPAGRVAMQFVGAEALFVASRSRCVGAILRVLRKQPRLVARKEPIMFERIAIRAAALALSGLITLTVVAALSHTADSQHAQACVAYWHSLGGVQQVVITGQRQPRS